MDSFFARRCAASAALVAALLGGIVTEAFAKASTPTMITGLTARDAGTNGNQGCGGGTCHYHNAVNINIEVTISGPPGSSFLAAGQSQTYTITIKRGNHGGMLNSDPIDEGTPVGLATAASDPGRTLTVSGTEPMSEVGINEVIHNSPRMADANHVATFKVTYKMPENATPGSTHTLYATAHVSADTWNHAANFPITVPLTAPSNPATGDVGNTTATLSWTGGGPEYRVVYKVNLNNSCPVQNENDGSFVTTSQTTVTLTGLTKNTQYCWKVFSKASGQNVFSSGVAPNPDTFTTTNFTAVARAVDAASGVDSGDCVNTACKTITYAMGQSNAGTGNYPNDLAGDAILVFPGTYNVALGEVFPITFKNGVRLRTAQGTGSTDVTIIDATGANARIFNVDGGGPGETYNRYTVLEGFTLKGGNVKPAADGSVAQGGAMYITNKSSIRIRFNVFLQNTAQGFDGDPNGFYTGGSAEGGAIYSLCSAPKILTNIFRENVARGGTGATSFAYGGNGTGGAIHTGCDVTDQEQIYHNTFYGNQAIGGTGGSSNGAGTTGGNADTGAVYAGGYVSIGNNIFVNNSAVPGAGGAPNGATGASSHGALFFYGSLVNAGTNLFFGNTGGADTPSTGNVLQDPLFLNAPTNLHIRNSSPATAAGFHIGGLAGVDFDYNTRGNYYPSIGAYEPTLIATTTAVVSNANPSTSGQSVTFTATVSSLFGTPTGLAYFRDDQTPLCDGVTVTSGQAQCTISSLTAGTHSIFVDFLQLGAPPDWNSSTSNPLSQTVNTTACSNADSDGDGMSDCVEVAEGRNPAVKDNDVFANARLFAMQQYRDFLSREGDSGGIAFWTNQIQTGGQTRAQCVESFFNSAEFQDTIAPVVRLYFAYFLRVPDYGGLQFWIDYRKSGHSLDEVSNHFAASPEFQDRYGALSNSAYVTLVYNNVLGRAPDTEGLNFWVNQLNTAQRTRGQVMLEFSESAEYRALSFVDVYVTMMYVGMLRRSPDPGGFDFWTGYMDAGNSGLALIDGFLAAPEYRGRFLP